VEDAELTDAVKEHGLNNWVAVAALVPGRSNFQCRQRWLDYLDPTAIERTTERNRGKWTVEEDAKLTEAVKKRGKDWVGVAALVPGRKNDQCRYRWLTSLYPAIERAHRRR
jgi:myb proto-oncogene protein